MPVPECLFILHWKQTWKTWRIVSKVIVWSEVVAHGCCLLLQEANLLRPWLESRDHPRNE
jgi:hypothetical protein